MTLLQFLPATLLRWGAFLAMAATIGGLALDLLVLPRGVPELAAVRRTLRTWNRIAVLALLLTTVAELVVRAQTMRSGPLAAAFAAIPVVLTHTHFGMVWIARASALGLLLLLVPASSLRLRWMALLLAVGVALTTGLTGHAAAWGDLSLSVLADWAHIAASAAWTGGLGALAFVALVQRSAWPPAFLAEVARRFSRLAGLCLLAVVGSGAYNAWVQVGSWSALWSTAYGRVLIVKLLIVAGLVTLGAVNRYAIIPRLAPNRNSRGIGARLFQRGYRALFPPLSERDPALPSRLSANVARDVALAVVVFACTAILAESTPGRHATRGQHVDHAAIEGGSPLRAAACRSGLEGVCRRLYLR